jgi:hypothetical protein
MSKIALKKYAIEIDALCEQSMSNSELLRRKSYLANLLEVRYNQNELDEIIGMYKPSDISKFEKLKLYRRRQLLETDLMLENSFVTNNPIRDT